VEIPEKKIHQAIEKYQVILLSIGVLKNSVDTIDRRDYERMKQGLNAVNLQISALSDRASDYVDLLQDFGLHKIAFENTTRAGF